MSFKVFVIFLAVVAAVSATPLKSILDDSTPTACTATKIYITVLDGSKNVMNYSIILSARPNTYNTDVSLTDLTFKTTDASTYNIGKGLSPSVTVDYGSAFNCTSNCHFQVGNSSVSINFPFTIKGQTQYVALVRNIVDENAISHSTGDMFTLPGNPCHSTDFQTPEFAGITFNVNQCCIKTAPVNVSSATASPACQKFTAETVFFQNFNPIINMFTLFSYSNYQLNASIGNSGTFAYYSYAVNDDVSPCIGNQYKRQTCQSSFSHGDFKGLLQFTLYTNSTGNMLNEYTTNLGRLIIRNGATLMAEGVPFTKDNACIYTQQSYDHASVTTNTQFCCSQFSH